MGLRDDKLKACGFDLIAPGKPKALYKLLNRSGSLCFTSGTIPLENDKPINTGKVPSAVTVETAALMARLCMANIFRAIYGEYGSLDAIAKAVKLTGYVNTDTDFHNQHLIINGASQLLLDVLGEEAGAHSRAALGVAMLPLNSCVEIEAVFEMK